MSTEHTFACDIVDTDALDTALLELSSEIMFRLLDEGLSSKTVHIKIRYADFRTVSAQETGDTAISDSTDLFARARTIFGKKYERGNPVRLLGLGVFNVTDGKEPEQRDLFDDGKNDRRRMVEEAVHTLAKKRGKRDIVTKARLVGQDRKERDE